MSQNRVQTRLMKFSLEVICDNTGEDVHTAVSVSTAQLTVLFDLIACHCELVITSVSMTHVTTVKEESFKQNIIASLHGILVYAGGDNKHVLCQQISAIHNNLPDYRHYESFSVEPDDISEMIDLELVYKL